MSFPRRPVPLERFGNNGLIARLPYDDGDVTLDVKLRPDGWLNVEVDDGTGETLPLLLTEAVALRDALDVLVDVALGHVTAADAIARNVVPATENTENEEIT